MLDLATRFISLGLAGFTVLAVAVVLARRPMVLVNLLLAAYFWQLTFTVPSTSLAGIGISPIDAVNVVAFGAAIIRLRRTRGLPWALAGFTALVLFATVEAILVHGGTALLGFRAELYVGVPALLAATLPASDVPRVLRAVWRFGVAMAVLAVSRWLLHAVGIEALGLAGVDPGGYAVPRVINATSALWVTFAAVMASWRLLAHGASGPGGRLVPVTTLGLFGVVLFAQHRSVWLATAAMLAVLMLRSRGRVLTKAILVVVLVSTAISVEAFELGDGGVVTDSFTRAVTNTGTWEWRLERWNDVWSTHAERGPGAIVFGSGYGTSWVSGQVGTWEVSPHNGYLQIAVRLGLVGAALFFGAYLALLVRLPTTSASYAAPLYLVTIGALAYYVPYSATPLTGVLLGVGLVILAHAPDRASDERELVAPLGADRIRSESPQALRDRRPRKRTDRASPA